MALSFKEAPSALSLIMSTYIDQSTSPLRSSSSPPLSGSSGFCGFSGVSQADDRIKVVLSGFSGFSALCVLSQ